MMVQLREQAFSGVLSLLKASRSSLTHCANAKPTSTDSKPKVARKKWRTAQLQFTLELDNLKLRPYCFAVSPNHVIIPLESISSTLILLCEIEFRASQ